MNALMTRDKLRVAVDTDALLQDTYLLVIQLRQGAAVQSSPDLAGLCVRQIEAARQALEEAGLDAKDVEHILHAQCALLDETVLNCVKGDARDEWAVESLQARFFGRHQAGEVLYDSLSEELGSPAPNRHVLTVFHRVLMLGFQGRYKKADDAERVELLDALEHYVKTFEPRTPISTRLDSCVQERGWHVLGAPVFHGLAALIVLFCVWWGLDLVLKGSIATLLPGQG